MSEDKTRVSLAYKGLAVLPREVLKRLNELQVSELDLSHNDLSDLRCLNGLTSLRTLVLDFNKIESHVVFPSLPLLEILWINCNSISNLSIFIENVVNAFPCLRHLSMMNNEAAPSYFNGGSVEEYKDYRLYVISQVPKLKVLDDTAVKPEEKELALKTYERKRSRRGSTRDSNSVHRTK